MIFSLDEVINVFGNKRAGEVEFQKMLKKDFRKIRKIYREERGFFKTLKLGNKKILDIFVMACFYQTGGEAECQEHWQNFVRDCEIGGADFIETFM